MVGEDTLCDVNQLQGQITSDHLNPNQIGVCMVVDVICKYLSVRCSGARNVRLPPGKPQPLSGKGRGVKAEAGREHGAGTGSRNHVATPTLSGTEAPGRGAEPERPPSAHPGLRPEPVPVSLALKPPWATPGAVSRRSQPPSVSLQKLSLE